MLVTRVTTRFVTWGKLVLQRLHVLEPLGSLSGPLVHYIFVFLARQTETHRGIAVGHTPKVPSVISSQPSRQCSVHVCAAHIDILREGPRLQGDIQGAAVPEDDSTAIRIFIFVWCFRPQVSISLS